MTKALIERVTCTSCHGTGKANPPRLGCFTCSSTGFSRGLSRTETELMLAEVQSAASEIAKLRAILERSVEWWLREGKEKFDGAPEWMFAAREVTG